MDLATRKALNLQVLRRVDAHIDEILYAAKHVVMYELAEKDVIGLEAQWVRIPFAAVSHLWLSANINHSSDVCLSKDLYLS